MFTKKDNVLFGSKHRVSELYIINMPVRKAGMLRYINYERSYLFSQCESFNHFSLDLNYFPSCVIKAWVTIAPSGLSANLVINFPIFKSQTPTQFLVAVTASPKLSERLKVKIKDIYDQTISQEIFL